VVKAPGSTGGSPLVRAAGARDDLHIVAGIRPDSTRIGTALRLMAEDLATERRRVRVLQREVNTLKAQLAALQRSASPPREVDDLSPHGREPAALMHASDTHP
jgi:hypothetical protein